jgi:hypothetical protein
MYKEKLMPLLNRNPQNTNPLQPTKFLLTFSRIQTVQYFCQEINLPGVSLGEVLRDTPFLDMYSPGTKLTYDPLDITFTIDEELASWKNIYDWFTTIADPDGFENRNYTRELQRNEYFSDAFLTVLSALNNPILRIEFTNVFPLTLSDIQFDTKASADTIITARATFRYQSYRYLTA